LRNTGKLRALVSRLHRYDIYEESSRNNYIPLKRQYISKYNKLFTISEQAKQYLLDQYQAREDLVEVSRLGVDVPSSTTKTSTSEAFHLLSVSYCSPVKRIEKIIKALALMAPKNGDLKICWTHIGGGELLKTLRAEAKEKLSNFSNVTFSFMGNLTNKDVKHFLATTAVDGFINVSESEGVPVSIMEAMSHGIPAIATDVGGVSELVTEQNGMLLNPDINDEELALSLTRFIKEMRGDSQLRKNAKEMVFENYNAEKNYKDFIEQILSEIA
jgi:glycosyltransferase involved in cell wall biosynthesis